MIYSKLKLTLVLTITVIALFVVSCEQAVIDNNVPEVTETVLSSNALVNTIAADESFTNILESMSEELDSEEQGAMFVDYFENVLVTKYPELANMEKEEAVGIAFEAISQANIIELRCGCNSGCHWCCGYAAFGWAGWCFNVVCGGGGWCR